MSETQQKKRVPVDFILRVHVPAVFCIAYASQGDVSQGVLHIIQKRVGHWYREIGKDKNWELKAEQTTHRNIEIFVALPQDTKMLNTFFHNRVQELKRILAVDQKSVRHRNLILADWSAVLATVQPPNEKLIAYFEKSAEEIGATPQEFRMSMTKATRGYFIQSSQAPLSQSHADATHQQSSPSQHSPASQSDQEQLDSAGEATSDLFNDPTTSESDVALGAELLDEAFEDSDDESFNFEAD